MSDSEDGRFLRRLKDNSSMAANELDAMYRSKLCRKVEMEMGERFRARESPEDVVQSVLRTFFRRNAKAEFHIDSTSDLWRLLATITRHKMLKHIEYHDAEKRKPDREEHIEGDVHHGYEPSPEEVAVAADLMEKALADLDESYVQVFNLKLQNHTEREIAKKLGCTRAFVSAKLKRLRDRLDKFTADNSR